MNEDFEGLPPGPGREAVYFTCTACHSLNQFTQQRMGREDWDQTISRMVHDNKMAAPRPWGQRWSAQIAFPGKGYYEIWARATDDAGAMQTFAINWNPKGYLNNTMHRIAVRVAA